MKRILLVAAIVIAMAHSASAQQTFMGTCVGPDSDGGTWRTLAVTIPLTDLVSGTNVVQIGGDQTLVTSNVNIVLGNVPGGVPVLPGNSRSYPN
jgi:hypothetical protein